MLKKKVYLVGVDNERAIERHEIVDKLPVAIKKLPDYQNSLNRFLNGTGDVVDCEFESNLVTFRFSKVVQSLTQVVMSETLTKSYMVPKSGNGVVVACQINDVHYYNEDGESRTKLKIAYMPHSEKANYIVVKGRIKPIGRDDQRYEIEVGYVSKEGYFMGEEIDWTHYYAGHVTTEDKIDYEIMRREIQNSGPYGIVGSELVDVLEKALQSVMIEKGKGLNLKR